VRASETPGAAAMEEPERPLLFTLTDGRVSEVYIVLTTTEASPDDGRRGVWTRSVCLYSFRTDFPWRVWAAFSFSYGASNYYDDVGGLISLSLMVSR